MREHLYRGKIIPKKYRDRTGWIYGHLMQSNGVCIKEGDSCPYEVDPETVGEWTGLYDKNKVRIFEGDIVKTESPCPFSAAVIEWQPKEVLGWFVSFCEDRESRDFLRCNTICEVIGNIHGNPELLDGE